MYVFGGFDGRARFNDLKYFSLDQPYRWQAIRGDRGQQAPRSRFGHTSVVYANSMFIFGGWDGHQTLDELYEYNFP